MCGRFTLLADELKMKKRFKLTKIQDNLKFRYNVAPGEDVFAIIFDGKEKRGGFLRWGLVPFWAKDEKIGYKMINARVETAHEKPSFKHLLTKRRCLIIADGFYEWKKRNGSKQPYRIMMKDDQPFAFAGLWDRWKNDHEIITTCTIITTEANEIVQPIHARTPVILTEQQHSIWLDPTIQAPSNLKNLLQPYPPEKMKTYEVSTLVNSPKNDSPQLLNSL